MELLHRLARRLAHIASAAVAIHAAKEQQGEEAQHGSASGATSYN